MASPPPALDLFEKGVTVVTAPYGTPENVFKLTTDFIALLGSMPLLMDTAEADGLLGKVQVLPQLAAEALLDATLDQPGWQEAKKLSSRPYATVTSGFAYHDDAVSLREFALENRENMVRLLNSYKCSEHDVATFLTPVPLLPPAVPAGNFADWHGSLIVPENSAR